MMNNIERPERRKVNELLEYRLDQIEKKLDGLDSIVTSIGKDQMRFRMDDHKLESLTKNIASIQSDLSEIKQEMPLLIHFKKRVDIVLKSLLSAFMTALIGAVIYAIKMAE